MTATGRYIVMTTVLIRKRVSKKTDAQTKKQKKELKHPWTINMDPNKQIATLLLWLINNKTKLSVD